MVLFVLGNYEKIQHLASNSRQALSEQEQIQTKAPTIRLSGDELNRRFGAIAASYDLSEKVDVLFIVNERGEIKNPEISGVDNPRATGAIIDLLKSADITPGSVSGKPASIGMAITLRAS